MWLVFAFLSACLTSFLPIVNKRPLAKCPPSVVAWAVNGLSLPLLGLVTLLLFPIPAVDAVFWLGIFGSGVLNMMATFLSTHALQRGDASLATPILTFNPAFTAIVAVVTLGEVPTLPGLIGILTILAGAYVLNRSADGLRERSPFRGLSTDPVMLHALSASFVWGLTPIAEKLAMEHSYPTDPPLVAFGSTILMTLFLILPMLREREQALRYLWTQRRGFTLEARPKSRFWQISLSQNWRNFANSERPN